MLFEPRNVPRSCVRGWFVEALVLIHRRAWAYLCIGILPIILNLIDGSRLLGVMLNKFIVLLFAVSALLLLVVLAFPVLFFPWLALTTSMMYVSYRDIWLNKPKNEPAKSRDAAALASDAA